MKARKTIKRKKTNQNKTIKRGGGIIGNIGSGIAHAAVHREKKRDLRTSARNIPGLGKYGSIINTATSILTEKKVKDQFMKIIYNIGREPIDLDKINLNKQSISTNKLDREPRVNINSNDRFLLALVDNDRMPTKRVFWIGEYVNRGKAKSIITYKTPKILKSQQTQLGSNIFMFKLFNYPKGIDYKPINPLLSNLNIESNNKNTSRNAINSTSANEYINLMRFLTTHNIDKPITVKILNTKLIETGELSIFGTLQRRKAGTLFSPITRK